MKFDAVLIAGPTASGKTAAALGLAQAIGGAVINVDSMQVYRELRILSARPSEEEMRRVPHMLFGHVSVREPYSVGRYRSEAATALQSAGGSGQLPVFVGGTGLYFTALTEGLADIPRVPRSVRASARERLVQVGKAAFHAELAERDPAMAARLRASDTQRVLRAWEVFEATGRSLACWQRENAGPVLAGLRLARFVLQVPGDELRARIAYRFAAMIGAGAREEAAALAGISADLPAARALGLRELNGALAGEIDQATAVARAVTRTCQFAKRQRTWFRQRMSDWHAVEGDTPSNIIAGMMSMVA